MSTSTVSGPVRVQSPGLLVSLLISGVLPILVYFLAERRLHGAIAPLAVTFAIPVVWTAVGMVWRRRLDPVGVLAVIAFGIRLLVAVLLPRDGALALKIGPFDIVEGVAGLVLLVSALIRRPLLLEVITLAGRVNPALAALHERARGWHSMGLVTAIVGGLLFADSALHLVLALFLPTTVYVVLSNVKRWVLLGAAAVAVLLRVRYQRRHPVSAGAAPPTPATPVKGGDEQV